MKHVIKSVLQELSVLLLIGFVVSLIVAGLAVLVGVMGKWDVGFVVWFRCTFLGIIVVLLVWVLLRLICTPLNIRMLAKKFGVTKKDVEDAMFVYKLDGLDDMDPGEFKAKLCASRFVDSVSTELVKNMGAIR